MTSEPLDLDAIEARANAATEGPWYWWTPYDEKGWEIKGGRRVLADGDELLSEKAVVITGAWHNDSTASARVPESADAEFIAASRSDVPDLVAALREARAEVERLTGIIAEVAASGVEFETRKYVVVQIDNDTWREAKEVAR